jgi:lipoate-protein ligase A
MIDTGTRRAAENFAFNRALLESRKRGIAASTLRFLQFTPSALLGYHQSAEQELDVDYCAANGIDVQRRITGGGAIYMDEGQLGWELYVDRGDVGGADMAAIAKRICDAAARGISSLGVDARFRPRNDIEVDGRKISGTGGAFDGEALMYQGTLLVDFDVERMVRCLRIPSQKVAAKAIADARERVRDLRGLLGVLPPLAEVKARLEAAFAEEFDVAFAAGELYDAERKLFDEALDEIDTTEWIDLLRRPRSELPILESTQKFAGGLLRAAIAFDRPGDRIKQVWFTGDFFVNPRRAIVDLEAALKDAPLHEVRGRIDRFFQARAVDMLTLTPADFAVAVDAAVRAVECGDPSAAHGRRP